MYVDLMYAKLVGARLTRFKQKKQDLFEYACPMCGDDKNNKPRAYMYRTPSGLNAQCKHCGYSRSLGNFIRDIDQDLYKQYRFEKFRSSPSITKIIPSVVNPLETVELISDSVLDSLSRVDKMDVNHPASILLRRRNIPEKYFKLFYYTKKFKSYVNSIIPDKFDNNSLSKGDHPRLIIPYFDNHGKVFAFQGRAFGDEIPKYFTIKLSDKETIYGLDRVDYSKRIYITEGPIDSLFLNNGIAVSGSSFDLPSVSSLKSISTICFDNEPRSKPITNLILKMIDRGYSVYLPPDNIVEKDINDLIISGKTSIEIMKMIDENTYQGAPALLRFNYWRKC